VIASTAVSYDVLAIVDAMETQGVDAGVAGAVGDAIGHLGTSTLDVLRTCGMPALKVFAVRKALDAARAVTEMSQVHALCCPHGKWLVALLALFVCSALLLHLHFSPSEPNVDSCPAGDCVARCRLPRALLELCLVCS
jgi:hypothetical protein